MHLLPAHQYHIYNQGNNRETLFYCREDYLRFLQLVRKHVMPHCDVLAWCLMPNHFHFLILTNASSTELIKLGGNNLTLLNNGFRLLQTNYAQYANARYARTGSLFRQKAKSKCLTDEAITEGDDPSPNDIFNSYPWVCFHYIHQNPVKAGLAAYPEDWEFSSFRDYAGQREGTLCNVVFGRKLTGLSEDDFNYDSIELPAWRVRKLFE